MEILPIIIRAWAEVELVLGVMEEFIMTVMQEEPLVENQAGIPAPILEAYMGVVGLEVESMNLVAGAVTVVMTVTNSFQEFGTDFEIIGVKLGNNGIRGALNFSTNNYGNVTIYGTLTGEKWEHWSDYGIDLGINVRW